MKLLTKSIFTLFVLAFAAVANAGGVFTLPQLDQSQIDALYKSLGSDMAFRAVEPANDFGPLGVVIGVTGIASSASSISTIINSSSPLPDADLNVGIYLPKGFGIELGFMPGLAISGTTFSRIGGDLKWTFSDFIFEHFPVSLAARGMYTTSHLTYSQALSGGNLNVDYQSSVYGGILSVSKSFLFVEPWAGVGFISHNTTLSGTGTANLFNGTFPVGTTSFSGTGSGLWWQAGVEFRFGFFGLGVEYDNVFGVDSYSGKLSFRI